jgi:preprotein translocase subunit SecG
MSTMIPILGSAVVVYSVSTLFVIVCLLLIGVVLVQKPKGGGLSGAFGGGASTAQSAFGARTGDILTWFTVGSFVVFLALSIILTLVSRADAPAKHVDTKTSQNSSAPLTPIEKPATQANASTPATPAPATTEKSR